MVSTAAPANFVHTKSVPMKISFKWLQDLLPLTTSVEDAAAVLTATGLEVEGVESVEGIPGGLKGLVVGEITACGPHPNADRLQVCEVNVGAGEPLSIVCGAKNARKGLRVVVATVGTELHPINGDSFKIKKGKIRGEVSMGMICAEDEIGVGQSHAGIIELDEKWTPGTPVAAVYNLESDAVLEIGLTPNRTDGMSHYGVARDLRAGLLHGTVEGIQEAVGTVKTPATAPLPTDKGPFQLSVETGNGCPRYLGLLIEGVRIGPSPDSIQQRLRAIGVNPQNNVVDATNYVLHEMGQPLHAFDADAIDGNAVKIRHPHPGEKLTTLDGEERTLHADDQVIADANKAMCLAGVFGGDTSGVSESTTRVFLESAYFNPVVTRKMAKRHGLSTDASFRFERGVDPEIIEAALARAATLITEWAGGKATGMHEATGGDLPAGQTVTLEWAQLCQLIGISLEKDTVHAILQDLDITVVRNDDIALEVNVPAYRHDVTRPADVVEEILRIYGFDKIPLPERLISTAAHQAGVPAEAFRLQTSNFLVSRGFQEMMNNSMTRASYTQDFGEDGADGWDLSRQIALLNPLSSDLGVMRQSLLFQGLEAVVRNANHQRPDLRLFELGNVYQHRPNADTESENAAQRYEETERLAIFMTGAAALENWNNASGVVDAYALKSEVYNLLASLGISQSSVKDSPLQTSLICEGVEMSCQGQVIGRMGKVRSSVAHNHGVKQDVFWADLAVKPLTKISGRSRVKAKELTKFPSVRRDLSLILKKDTPFGAIRDAAMKAEKKLLKRIGLFDVYEGKNLEPGHVSFAVSLVLQDEEKTLNEKRIEQSVQRILDGIVQATGAQLRD